MNFGSPELEPEPDNESHPTVGMKIAFLIVNRGSRLR